MKNKYILIISLFIGMVSNAQSLKDYLSIAEANSPELQAIQYKYESNLEKINEVGSIPNTTIGAGYFALPVETRVGAQRAKFTVTQKLPWFGTLGAKEESAAYKAEAVLNTIDLAKRNLFLNVKTSYYNLVELKAKEKIVKENIVILETFEKLALTELENNRSTMVDVLKIRMEKNELSNTLNTIIENYKASQITFNLLLNRNEREVLNVIDSLNIQYNETVFQKELISSNPKLLQLDNLQSSLEQTELATKKEGLPVFGIGLDYIIVDERPIQDLEYNGRDIVMPMLTVSVPLFSKKFSAKRKQLQLEQKAIETTKVNTNNQLLTIFENSLSKRTNAQTSIKTQQQNIAEAERAKNVLLAAYETSKIDFEQLLEIQQLSLKFQLKKVVSEKEYAIQESTLEFLTQNN